MTIQEIHALLNERFGDSIGALEEALTPWFEVKADALTGVAKVLRDEPALKFDMLRNLCGADHPDKSHLMVVYHFFSFTHHHDCALKVLIERTNPVVPTLSGLWPAANWHEREAFDLYGIRFEGHPDLRRMFLPEDWEGFPLRKDYVMPVSYHGIPNIVE